MSQYMHDLVPVAYHMTAAIDGASWNLTLTKVVIRRAMPGILAVGLFTLVLSWNDIALSMLLTEGINKAIGAAFSEKIFNTEQFHDYGTFAAASLTMVVTLGSVIALLTVYVERKPVKEGVGSI